MSRPKSSYQELLELVAENIASKDEQQLAQLHDKLVALRAVFDNDRDLLETVIRRIERAMSE